MFLYHTRYTTTTARGDYGYTEKEKTGASETPTKDVAVKKGGNRNAEIIERLEASFSHFDEADFGPPHIFSLCRFLGILVRNYEENERRIK